MATIAQELVAAVVPERVVDLLEAVEVDEQDPDVFWFDESVQLRLGVLHEGAAVLRGR